MSDARPVSIDRPEASPPALDAAAIAQLQALDPTGRGGLVRRVLLAFESSSARLSAQLETARAEGDRATMRLVAHTLKSSAAIVGATRLSQLAAAAELALHHDCAEAELQAHLDAMQNGVSDALAGIASTLKNIA